MAFSCDYFKKLNSYRPLNRLDSLLCNLAFLVGRDDEYLHPAIPGLYLRDTPVNLLVCALIERYSEA